MNDKRDPLDVIRAAWEHQDADVPGESLEDQDPATRQTVRYLREAWRRSAAEHPVETPPELLRPTKELGSPRWALLMIGLLGASAAGWLLWLAPLEVPDRIDPGERVAGISSDGPDSQLLRTGGRARHVAESDFTARDDGIELRSGSVRLILITPGAVSAGSSEDL